MPVLFEHGIQQPMGLCFVVTVGDTTLSSFPTVRLQHYGPAVCTFILSSPWAILQLPSSQRDTDALQLSISVQLYHNTVMRGLAYPSNI